MSLKWLWWWPDNSNTCKCNQQWANIRELATVQDTNGLTAEACCVLLLSLHCCWCRVGASIHAVAGWNNYYGIAHHIFTIHMLCGRQICTLAWRPCAKSRNWFKQAGGQAKNRRSRPRTRIRVSFSKTWIHLKSTFYQIGGHLTSFTRTLKHYGKSSWWKKGWGMPRNQQLRAGWLTN